MPETSTMSSMRAVYADPEKAGTLFLADVPVPTPLPHQALVKVQAFSLNAGDTRSALATERAYVPGWDFAGVVEKAAADGSSPPVGSRVFGFVFAGAWAQYVAVSSGTCAPLPDSISFEQAASLPVASLTALRSLRLAGGNLRDKNVLITGAAGGVGRYACQIASSMGAKVFAISRRPDLMDRLANDGVKNVTVFKTMEDAKAAGSYDYILDSVGGSSLAIALGALNRRGVCVTCGNSSGEKTTFEVRDFYMKCDVTFHGFYLASAFSDNDATPDLIEVARLVEAGVVNTPIGDQRSWKDIDKAAHDLKSQNIDGKIILKID